MAALDPTRIALSTMYLQHKGWTLQAFWEQAQALGFEAIEVSHVIREDMTRALQPGEVPIAAVHAPAPKAPNPRHWDAMRHISATDEEARRWAVAQVERSIRWAAEMGAQAVCVHLGTVAGLEGDVWVLEQRFLAGQRGHPLYERQKGRVLAARAQLAPPHMDAARRSLEHLLRVAEAVGVRLGLESRRYVHEIPSFEEMEQLLAEYDTPWLGFWYDIGHCQVQENLGFVPQSAWWNILATRGVGVHLHDVIGLRDHLVPGMGEVAFAEALRWVPEHAVVTFEVDWYFRPDEVAQGLQLIRALARRSER